jgi:hypothetical protein
MRSLAPIIFFCYNRPDHTRQVLESLYNNRLSNESSLWIYVDGPKPEASEETLAAISKVKEIIREKKWCGQVTIVESELNKGLIQSNVEGVTRMVNEFGKVIAVEDDNLLSPGFLTFMNDALDFYEHNPNVMHVCGYVQPVFRDVPIGQSTYFFYHTYTWGWGTWKRAWDKFNTDPLEVWKAVKAKGNMRKLNMDQTFEFFWGLKAVKKGKLQSWNASWHSTVFLNDGLCLYPQKSMVSNIGHDGSGTNCEPDERYRIQADALADYIPVNAIALEEHKGMKKQYIQSHSFKYRVVFLVKHYLRYLVGY